MKKLFGLMAIVLLLASCGQKKQEQKQERKQVQLIDTANFNKVVDGKQVSLYTLRNGDLTMQVTNYGGRVVALWTPDKNKSFEDVVLGYDHIDKYLDNQGERFLGAVVGRCANRIAGGLIKLNGVEYQLPKNDGNNTLHGGELGTDRVVWDVMDFNDSTLALHVVLPDGQDGFPGNLDITMTYSLTKENEFRIDYLATTDKTTLCNLSHHSFFNLKGEGNDILGHELMIDGAVITPVNEELIPRGGFLNVKGTPFDFNTMHAIGRDIDSKHDQLVKGHGFDHNWIVRRSVLDELKPVATLYEPETGRQMVVVSDQLGLQFYSGNFFDGKAQGKWGTHVYRGAVALETQNFPDAIHQERFSIKPVLNLGEEYRQTCIYKFSVRE